MTSRQTTDNASDHGHIPVMLTDVLERLAPKAGDLAIDATLGLGGHSVEILKAIQPGGKLLGIDRDPEMLRRASERLAAEAPEGSDWRVVNGNASNLRDLLCETDFGNGFDLFLMDAGVCSAHFDDADRGFSMIRDGRLSMKLDPNEPGPDAEELINSAEPGLLVRIIKVLGEEPQARRIVERIVKARAERRITTTTELADIVREAYPARFRGGRRHEATRTFQSIRIFVNNELESLAKAVRQSLEMLNIGGRAAFISFHSLEDKLVKRSLVACSQPFYPTAEDFRRGSGIRSLEIIKRAKADEAECAANPRSRSAILRACRKVAPLQENIAWPTPPQLQAA